MRSTRISYLSAHIQECWAQAIESTKIIHLSIRPDSRTYHNRASLLNYKQASRDQRIHGNGFWVVSYSSLYGEDGGDVRTCENTSIVGIYLSFHILIMCSLLCSRSCSPSLSLSLSLSSSNPQFCTHFSGLEASQYVAVFSVILTLQSHWRACCDPCFSLFLVSWVASPGSPPYSDGSFELFPPFFQANSPYEFWTEQLHTFLRLQEYMCLCASRTCVSIQIDHRCVSRFSLFIALATRVIALATRTKPSTHLYAAAPLFGALPFVHEIACMCLPQAISTPTWARRIKLYCAKWSSCVTTRLHSIIRTIVIEVINEYQTKCATKTERKDLVCSDRINPHKTHQNCDHALLKVHQTDSAIYKSLIKSPILYQKSSVLCPKCITSFVPHKFRDLTVSFVRTLFMLG